MKNRGTKPWPVLLLGLLTSSLWAGTDGAGARSESAAEPTGSEVEEATSPGSPADPFDVGSAQETQNGGVGNGQGFELTSGQDAAWFFDPTEWESLAHTVCRLDYEVRVIGRGSEEAGYAFTVFDPSSGELWGGAGTPRAAFGLLAGRLAHDCPTDD